MSDESDDIPEGDEEDEDEAKVPPAGYVPGAAAVPGQAVGDRGEVLTFDADGELLTEEEPGEQPEPV